MRRWVSRAAVLLAVSLPAMRARAIHPDKSPAQLTLEDWQVKDGLPGDSVRAIEQAGDGQLWVATFGGVVHYDGLRFSPVSAPHELKLGVGDVTQVLPARDGSVWLVPAHRGPMRVVAGETRGFGPNDGLPAGTVAQALAQDEEGHVWMATSRGLWKFANERFVARPVRDLAGPRTPETPRPSHLAIDHQGTPWLGTDRGLFVVVGDRLQRPGVNIGAPVTAMHVDRRRVLWVAAGETLTAIDGATTSTLGRAAGLPAAAVTQIEHDDDDNLWLATAAGLVRVRNGRAQVFTDGFGVPGVEVTAVKVDREGGLWVGTRLRGLHHLTDRTLDTGAATATRAGLVPPGLESTETMALCEDEDGAMWFGTRDRGLVRWQGGRARWLTTADGLPSNAVTALLPDGPGALWVGTQAGLVRYAAGKLHDPKSWPRRVRTLYRDRRGDPWVGGDGMIGRITPGAVTLYSRREGLISGHVRALAEDADGALWVTGLGGVVQKTQTTGGGFARNPLVPGKVVGAVRSMLLDAGGSFWMTTGRAGLVRLQGGQMRAFDARVGLEPNMLYGLLEDDRGDLWIGTNRSILRVARASLDAVAAGQKTALEIATFEATDRRAGVIATQLHQPSAWKTRDGALWFLTQQGPVRIDPASVHTNKVLPRVNIDAALADGQVIAGGGRGQVARPPSRLEFQYGAITLLQPSKVRYRHRLEGYDAAWVEAGDRRVAVYHDTPAGSYRFRVQASNNDGLWNERGASFTFVVAPPYYRRWWFIALGALALLPVGWLVHRGHVQRVHAQYLGVIAERARMARELHDTLLQGMATVGIQLHGLRRHMEHAAPEARHELDLVHATVTQCLDETRRVLRGLRADEPAGEANGAMGPRAGTLGVALERLAQRLRASLPPATGDGAAAEVAVIVEGEPRPLPHAVQDEFYRIGQEALTNALRHAAARRIELRLCYEPEQVRLCVRDDGRGFDPAADGATSGLHFGLRGLRERAARLDGMLEVKSRPGAGTVVEVVVMTRPSAVARLQPATKERLA